MSNESVHGFNSFNAVYSHVVDVNASLDKLEECSNECSFSGARQTYNCDFMGNRNRLKEFRELKNLRKCSCYKNEKTSRYCNNQWKRIFGEIADKRKYYLINVLKHFSCLY